MPKRREANQDSFFVNQNRLPLQTARAAGGKVLALDAWEGPLRVAQGISAQDITVREKQDDYTPGEIERLKATAVYATEESWEGLQPFEARGLKVRTLPRAMAVYWSFRE